MTYKLVVAPVGLCRHAVRIGGGFSWELSNGNELWNLVIVRNFFAKVHFILFGLDRQFVDDEGVCSMLRRNGKSGQRVLSLAPYARIPEHLGHADFRPCCGKVSADSAFYTPFFAELVWRALRTVVVMPARTRAEFVLEGCFLARKPSMPLWCAMVTRTIY